MNFHIGNKQFCHVMSDLSHSVSGFYAQGTAVCIYCPQKHKRKIEHVTSSLFFVTQINFFPDCFLMTGQSLVRINDRKSGDECWNLTPFSLGR